MSDKEKRFPVIGNHSEVKFVKWSELSDRMAQSNHSQSLKRLAERGGLCPKEIVGNIEGIGWSGLSAITGEHAEEVVQRIAWVEGSVQ